MSQFKEQRVAMLVDIYLTDTETGYSKVYHDKYEWEDVEEFWSANTAIIYQYTEGNYSCDCNRSLFLHDWEEGKVKPCGNTIRLDKIVDRGTGSIIWDEVTQAKEDEEIRLKLNLIQKFGMHFI